MLGMSRKEAQESNVHTSLLRHWNQEVNLPAKLVTYAVVHFMYGGDLKPHAIALSVSCRGGDLKP